MMKRRILLVGFGSVTYAVHLSPVVLDTSTRAPVERSVPLSIHSPVQYMTRNAPSRPVNRYSGVFGRKQAVSI